MSDDKMTMAVAVHKAAINLGKDESIEQYTQELRTQGTKHVLDKLNKTKKTASAYLVEAYANSAVFAVYDHGSGDTDMYYATKYKRAKPTDDFEFDSLVEVQRVSQFKPKPNAVAIKKELGDAGRDWVEKTLFGNIL